MSGGVSGWSGRNPIRVRLARLGSLLFGALVLALGSVLSGGALAVAGAASIDSSSTALSPLSIATVIPAAFQGHVYSATLGAVGGTPAYKWSIVSGGLPNGMKLAALTGAVTGTPTDAGSFPLTVEVTDHSIPTPQTASQSLMFVVAPSSLAITTTTLSEAVQGTAFSVALRTTGGAGTDTWSQTSGSLPPGITLSSGGLLSGTPSQAGTFSYSVAVTDGSTPTPQTAIQALTLLVASTTLAITTQSLPEAFQGTSFSTVLHATGGAGNETWSVTSGSVPNGITLSSNGSFSGVPSGAGTSSFTVAVTDRSTPTPQTATQSLTISVAPMTLAITTPVLPEVVQGQPYSATLGTTGGAGARTWSVSSGSLPQGMVLGAVTGTISGKPLGSGTFTLTVLVSDGSSPTPQSATQVVNLVVAPSALSVLTLALPSATSNTSYSTKLIATGGAGSKTWSVSSGSLPPGMVLVSSTGAISGKSTVPGIYPITFTVTDGSIPTPQIATQALSIVVN